MMQGTWARCCRDGHERAPHSDVHGYGELSEVSLYLESDSKGMWHVTLCKSHVYLSIFLLVRCIAKRDHIIYQKE